MGIGSATLNPQKPRYVRGVAAVTTGFSHRLARRAGIAVLSRMREGRLELREEFSGRRFSFGPAGAERRAEITVHSPAFYARLLRDRSVGMAESFMQGIWDSPDLVALLRIGAREIARADRLRNRLAPALVPAQQFAQRHLRNTRTGARRNISAHYDLGNSMFELFLDAETMSLFERTIFLMSRRDHP